MLELKEQRSLASENPVEQKTSRPDLAEWARLSLPETERVVDLLAEGAQTREAAAYLSKVSDHLVSFHGYALQGNSRQMLVRLEQMEEEASRAHAIACPSVKE